MNKKELVDALADQLGDVTKADANRYVDAMIDVISHALKEDEDVSLPGFGNFKVSHRAPRNGRNPQTGETITIPGGRVLRFKSSSRLKEYLNGN